MSALPRQAPLFTAEAAPAVRPPSPVPDHQPARPALWLCLHLPDLCVQVFPEHESGQAFAVLETRGNRQTVCGVSAAAADAGIAPGMPYAAALARAPALLVRQRDPGAEARRLDWLARWCNRFASWISVQGPQAILLDVAGSLKLFGGLTELHRGIRAGLMAHGHHAQSAVAPTPRAALWLARGADNSEIDSPARLASVIEALPIEVLEPGPKHLRRLRALGARRIGELARLPRDGLVRRFGRELLRQIDQAYGRLPEPLPCIALPEHFRAEVELPLPSAHSDQLLAAAEQALPRLRDYLRAHDRAIDAFECRLFHDGLAATVLRIGSSTPTRDAGQLAQLLRDRLERETLPAPVRLLRLEATDFIAHAATTGDAFDRRPDELAWPALLDRLRARLGDPAVQGFALHDDHRPERAHGAHGDAPVSAEYPPRPLWLLPEPEPLAERDGRPWRQGPLTLLSGPERIEQGWWDGNDISRDYYRARDAHGNHAWLFQDRRRLGWFLHGWFA